MSRYFVFPNLYHTIALLSYTNLGYFAHEKRAIFAIALHSSNGWWDSGKPYHPGGLLGLPGIPWGAAWAAAWMRFCWGGKHALTGDRSSASRIWPPEPASILRGWCMPRFSPPPHRLLALGMEGYERDSCGHQAWTAPVVVRRRSSRG